MAVFIVLGLITIITGALIGAYLRLCGAIRREDRRRSVRFDAPSQSAQAARDLVGISSSRWD
jgi:hypothetical protein